jgi:predicted small lipoprotein YifL
MYKFLALTPVIDREVKMNRQRGPRAVVLSVAAIALLSLAACGDAGPPQLLPRDTVVPVSAVTKYFPDVTKESSTGPNETSVGKPIASRSVVFGSADGKKKVTLSVDQYASASEAAAAYQTAVQGSKAAPGFNPAMAPDLGQEAFAGTSQVGAEMHFGLGARDGRLIMSATHAGDIPVTPDNSNNLISLGDVELTTAKQVLGPGSS